MYNWRIELALEECVAQLPDPSANYCLVMRMGTASSPRAPLLPAHSVPGALSFDAPLPAGPPHPNPSPQLPAGPPKGTPCLSQLQVLLVLAQSPTRPQEQIIAIATIAPNYPNPP